ncbi:MAG: hypothetical protein ACRYFX_09840 [Janthinobacterium lividum]
MTKLEEEETFVNVRAKIRASTHNALKVKQSRKVIDTQGTRPDMTEVVAEALDEWASRQLLGG